MQRAQIISRGVHKLAQTPWLSEAKKNGPFIYIIEQKKKLSLLQSMKKRDLIQNAVISIISSHLQKKNKNEEL